MSLEYGRFFSVSVAVRYLYRYRIGITVDIDIDIDIISTSSVLSANLANSFVSDVVRRPMKSSQQMGWTRPRSGFDTLVPYA